VWCVALAAVGNLISIKLWGGFDRPIILVGGVAMWSGIVFDEQQVIDAAMGLINEFMPLVYIVGGVAVFALVMVVIIIVAKKAAS
jgi:hypothetical protein